MSLNQSSFAWDKAESLGSSSVSCTMTRCSVWGQPAPQPQGRVLRAEMWPRRKHCKIMESLRLEKPSNTTKPHFPPCPPIPLPQAVQCHICLWFQCSHHGDSTAASPGWSGEFQPCLPGTGHPESPHPSSSCISCKRIWALPFVYPWTLPPCLGMHF